LETLIQLFFDQSGANMKLTKSTNRADTLASPDRFKPLATNVQATVIIQHDACDIDKLPVFPASAK
jgi:hypothetical protein